MFGLINLVTFCEKYPEDAMRIFKVATLGKVWFFYSVVGIHITCWLCEYLRSGIMDTYFYKAQKEFMEIYDEIYRKVFVEFGDYWIKSNPKSIMDYSNISVFFVFCYKK